MRTHRTTGARFLSVLAAVVVFASAALGPAFAEEPDAAHHKSLREALDEELIEIAACGIGASTGYAILMAIKSRIGSALSLYMSSGTILRNKNVRGQDMIVHRVEAKHREDMTQEIAKECVKHATEEKEKRAKNQQSRDWLTANSITLRAYESRLYLLSAYCIDFDKKNPEATDSFEVEPVVNPQLGQLFRFLEARSPAVEDVDGFQLAAQLAAWALNGNDSVPHIATKFDFRLSDRDRACQLVSEAGIGIADRWLCARANSIWDHRNSAMYLFIQGPYRSFFYQVPRSELGVPPGTLLFAGVRIGNEYKGTAYVFSTNCPDAGRGYQALSYPVTGTVSPDERQITMAGPEPRLYPTCQRAPDRYERITFTLREKL